MTKSLRSARYRLIIAAVIFILSWCYAGEISSVTQVGLKHGIVADLYPLWNGARALLHGVDPYSVEVTRQNENGVYGTTAQALGFDKGQRFAYPLYASLLVAPLTLVSYSTASSIAFFQMILLVGCSVGWIRNRWDAGTLFYSLVALSIYPVIFAIQSRQPTILFLAAALASLCLFNHKHYAVSGVLAALASGKPHIAIPIIAVLVATSLRNWSAKKAFPIYLSLCIAIFVVAGEILLPGWIGRWIYALHHYSQFTRPSLMVIYLGTAGQVSAIVVCVAAVAFLLRSNLPLGAQVGVACAAAALIIPYEPYNAILLLPPALWIVDNSDPAQLQSSILFVAVGISIGANLLGLILWRVAQDLAWKMPGLVVAPLEIAVAIALILSIVGVGRGGLRPAPVDSMSGVAADSHQLLPESRMSVEGQYTDN